ncbi:AHH domain-containing protein [Thaumasiovibrio sp. DFM-14]|uniref:AHH domain-containing protein n=1 Tax=Thaumasiovibrio sp. DFM-14 TaxID=3384792 RepID=UPI0039A06023
MGTNVVTVTCSELERDLFNVTGDKQFSAKQAKQFEIFYAGSVIDSIRYKRGLISKDDLRLNQHIRWEHNKGHSYRLAKNIMKKTGQCRPENVAAHHIVSWKDIRAAKSRLRLSAFRIDIDSAENGVFLPRWNKHVPHPKMLEAYSHSGIHTSFYYLNVEHLLENTIAQDADREDIVEVLGDIGDDIKMGLFPITRKIRVNEIAG